MADCFFNTAFNSFFKSFSCIELSGDLGKYFRGGAETTPGVSVVGDGGKSALAGGGGGLRAGFWALLSRLWREGDWFRLLNGVDSSSLLSLFRLGRMGGGRGGLYL